MEERETAPEPDDDSRPLLYSLLACVLLVAGLFVFVILGVVENIETESGLAAVVTVAAVAPVLLAARNILRGSYGSAVAWGYMALPLVALLVLFSIHLAKPAYAVGLADCDPLAASCSARPLQDWLPLICFLAAAVLLIAAVRGSRARDREEGTT